MPALRDLVVRTAALLVPLALATAQIAPIGPFTGGNREDFDSIAIGQWPCHPERILQGTAMLCATNAGSVVVAGSAQCSCLLMPMTGINHAFVGGAGHASIFFMVPATRFGGYFGLNCAIPDGTARFWAVSGALIATVPLTLPADCQYHWLGFQATGSDPISMVELISNLPNGQNLFMEGLEVDYVGSVETYCAGKVNSVGCTPSLEVEGFPRPLFGVPWTIRAVNVRPGFPGTMIYAIGGARAAVPFQCGTLCIGPTGIRRAVPSQSSFGQLCEGSYSLDMNAFALGSLGGNPSSALTVPGTVVRCQWWGRDPGFAPPCNSTLSNAVEYVVL